jgi:hypothetical protein
MLTNRTQEFLRKADMVIKKIEAMLDENYEQRAEKISDSDLQDMLSLVKQLRMRVDNNHLPPKNMRYRSLSRIVVDQWPLGTSLGNEISELDAYYVNL